MYQIFSLEATWGIIVGYDDKKFGVLDFYIWQYL